MYLPFDSMPGRSRLWVYQASRAFTLAEKKYLQEGLTKLCDQWIAHGVPLQTSFSIQWNQFVILAVDEVENGASGCSIDSSVQYLQGLQQDLGLDFFDRTRVAFLQEEKVNIYPLTELKTLFENRTLTAETIAFNNVVTTKTEWINHWQVGVKDCWLIRYLPKIAVVE